MRPWTCLGVDTVLCSGAQAEVLIGELERAVREFYGADPQKSASMARVISPRAHGRLRRLLSQGRVVLGGECDVGDLYVAPTVMVDAQAESDLSREEIFGPILLIETVESEAEAVAWVNARPEPLALYVFGQDTGADKARAQSIFASTRSGACLYNTVLWHFENRGLPFGGVGSSGMGKYHGAHSFKAFSHARAHIEGSVGTLAEQHQRLHYPPYAPPASAYGNLGNWLYNGRGPRL